MTDYLPAGKRNENGLVSAGRNEAEAKAFAAKYSQQHPGMYVTCFSCFGVYVSLHKRLNVFAPSDSVFGGYWLNGQFKKFTERQKIADQNATPVMA